MITEEDWKSLETLAEKAGASATCRVDVSKVKRGVWPRMKCQFGCAQYGNSLCCPPYTPSLAEMNIFLDEYTDGLLVQYSMPYPKERGMDWQQFDIDITNVLHKVLLEIEKAAMMKNYYKAFALKAGRCRLCKVCNLKKCIHPEEARPSLEACGIDVFALAEDNGFHAGMYTGMVDKVSVYGMVLIE